MCCVLVYVVRLRPVLAIGVVCCYVFVRCWSMVLIGVGCVARVCCVLFYVFGSCSLCFFSFFVLSPVVACGLLRGVRGLLCVMACSLLFVDCSVCDYCFFC